MRKITSESVEAFYNRKNFNKANMSITNSEVSTTMRLYDNTIAILSKEGKLFISNGGWSSNTTKERLNALEGVSIVQKKGVWYLNGKEWNGSLIEVV